MRDVDGRVLVSATVHRPLILLRLQHLQAPSGCEFEQLGVSIEELIDQWKVAGRFHSDGTSDCASLLHGGACCVRPRASVLVTTRVSRAATEPPLLSSTATGTPPSVPWAISPLICESGGGPALEKNLVHRSALQAVAVSTAVGTELRLKERAQAFRVRFGGDGLPQDPRPTVDTLRKEKQERRHC